MAATARPFRFGVSTRGSASPTAWRDLSRLVEALGYSTLLTPDHVGTPLAPIASLMLAAEATTTLRVGCHVFGNDFRHPVTLAKEAATIDVLSGGRFELGLGTGWLLSDYTTTGMSFDAPGVRVSRLAEAVQVLKGCFAEGPFSFSGTYYTVRDLDLRPKPAQRPRPPIAIGGGSPRVLGIAAREADIVAINFRTTAEGGMDAADITAEATDQKVEWIRAAAGERFASLELGVFAFAAAVTDDEPRAAVESLLKGMKIDDRVTVDEARDSPAMIVGSVDRIVEMLLTRRERFGISYVVIRDPDPLADASVTRAFAPVVTRLAAS